MIRCGIGYDVHRLAEDRQLVVGGVEIPHSRGLEGHSDGDVLSHAIADALLGAICAGDIGQHFPNTDESIRGISSIKILQRVNELLAEKNARAVNVDATVIAEAPRLRRTFRRCEKKLHRRSARLSHASASRRRRTSGLVRLGAAKASPRWRSQQWSRSKGVME